MSKSLIKEYEEFTCFLEGTNFSPELSHRAEMLLWRLLPLGIDVHSEYTAIGISFEEDKEVYNLTNEEAKDTLTELANGGFIEVPEFTFDDAEDETWKASVRLLPKTVQSVQHYCNELLQILENRSLLNFQSSTSTDIELAAPPTSCAQPPA
jgi:hypothetical protein